jgi:hypothetical protein
VTQSQRHTRGDFVRQGLSLGKRIFHFPIVYFACFTLQLIQHKSHFSTVNSTLTFMINIRNILLSMHG